MGSVGGRWEGRKGGREENVVGKIYFLMYKVSRAVIGLPILLLSSYNRFAILFIHNDILISSHIRVFIH